MKIQADRSSASINFLKPPLKKHHSTLGSLFHGLLLLTNPACHSLRIITAASEASELRRLTPVRRLTGLVEQAGEKILEVCEVNTLQDEILPEHNELVSL